MFYVLTAPCQCTSAKKTLSDETLGFPQEYCVSLIKARRSSSKSFASQNVICVRMSRLPGHLYASDSQNHCFRKKYKVSSEGGCLFRSSLGRPLTNLSKFKPLWLGAVSQAKALEKGSSPLKINIAMHQWRSFRRKYKKTPFVEVFNVCTPVAFVFVVRLGKVL